MVRKRELLKGGLVFLFLIVFFSNFVLGANIAYILKNPNRPDSVVMSVFNEMGANVTLIKETYVSTTNFAPYTAVFIGNERFTRYKTNIANIIAANPTIIMNRYYGKDWGLTDADGISQLSSNSLLSVHHLTKGVMQVYNTKSQPYYYLAWGNMAPELSTIAETYMGDGGLGAVIALGNTSDDLLNGKTLQDELCFFGIAKTKYWTNNARNLFKDCVGFVAVTCYTNADCNDSDAHTEDICVNPGQVNSYCLNNVTIECFNDAECGNDGFILPLFCNGDLNDDVWGDFNDYTCANNGTTQSDCQLVTNPMLNATCVNGCSNGSCLPEAISPVVNLTNLNPANNSVNFTNVQIAFQFNVTDDSPIANCSLSISEQGGIVMTNNSITNGAISQFDRSFATNGTYHWQILCIDIYNNLGSSEIRTLSIINPQCSDGIDNDGDSAIDYPNDFSCTDAQDNDETNPIAQCQDTIDNDADGWVDLIDINCTSQQDNNESGTGTTECSDGIDNDGDTFIDGYDPGCLSPLDDDEDNIANHIVISEVYYDAIDESDSEFVELYNPLNVSVDITGWTINDSGGIEATITSGIINAFGYFLIADGNWSGSRDNMSWPLADIEDEMTLTNTNYGIALMNGSNVVDAVGWGNPANASYYEGTPTAIVSQGYSIERLPGWPLGNGQDTNNNTYDFFAQPIANPSNSTSNASNVTYQCSDGLDNDLDGAIDMADFSCSSPTDDDETNPMAQCQDTIDNDGDLLVDMLDPGCSSLQDNDETNIVPSCSQDSDCGSVSSQLICGNSSQVINRTNYPTCLTNGSCMMINITDVIYQNCSASQVCSVGSCVGVGNLTGQTMLAWTDGSVYEPESIFWDSVAGWSNEQQAGQLPIYNYPYWTDIEAGNNQTVMLIDATGYNNAAKETYASVYENGAWTTPEFLGGGVYYYYYNAKTSAIESFGNSVMIIYSDSSSAPKYRIWDGNSWSPQSSARSLSNQPYWMILKNNNLDEMILLSIDLNNKVYSQVWDGNSFEDLIELESLGYLGGSIDVEYLYDGRAVVAWYDFYNKRIQYRIWDGSWSAEENTLDILGNEVVSYLQLASNPLANEMTLVSKSANGNIRVQVWDGSSWGNSALLGSGIFGAKTIDVEYDNSGRALVVWAEYNEKITNYALLDNGVVIDSGATLNSANKVPVWLELAADSNSNEMVLAEVIQRDYPYHMQGRVYSQVWDGSSWDNHVLLEDYYTYIYIGSVDVEYIETSSFMLMNIISPENRSYNYTLIDFNITTENAERCWLSLDSGNEIEMTSLNETDFYYSQNVNEGNHNAEFICEDEEGNSNSADVDFAVDLTAPSFILFGESPASPASYLPNQLYEFFAETDNSDIDSVWFELNGVNYTNVELLGNTYYFDINDLAVGNYIYNWCVNDTAGNSACYLLGYIINKGIMPLHLYINGNESNMNLDYNSPLNVLGLKDFSEGSLVLYRNGNLVANPDNSVLGVGNYNYTLIFPETENFTSNSLTRFLNIVQGIPSLSMDAAPNWTNGYGTQTTITGNCPAGLTCNLYRDENLVSNPDVAVLGMGSYNYTFNTSGNENYTSAEISNILTITKGTPSLSISSSAGWNTSYTIPTTTLEGLGCPVIGASDVICKLYNNDIEITNPSSLTLGVGNYAIKFNSTEGQNYSSASVENLLVVNKAGGIVWLYLNGVRSNLTAPMNSLIDINASRIKGEGNIQLYVNGNLINQGIELYNQTSFSSTGVYNITAVYPETQNYTASSETWFVNVTPIQSVLNLSLNNLYSNVVVNINQNVNITANTILPLNSYVELYEDSGLLANETYISLIRNYTTTGIRNITAVYRGNSDYYASNVAYLINVINDTIAPNITLISPADNYSTANVNLIFSYNVSDELDIASCILYINNVSYQTSINVLKDVTQAFSAVLTPASYTWRISCVDSAGNTGNSETRNLVVNTEEEDDEDNGGGSSGGGSSGTVYVNGVKYSKNETKKIESGLISLNEQQEQKAGIFDLIGNWIFIIIALILVVITITIIYFVSRNRN